MTTPDQVVTNILDDLRDPPHRALVVDSPPGAGKSTLVVRAARQLAEDDAQKMIVAQTNEQVDDLIDRLATADPALRIGRLSAANYTESERVQRPNVRIAQKHTDLTDRAIVIGTAAKWATVDDGTWSWAIVDEAYQMRSDMLLRIANRFDRALFVGDPGQLDPFATVDVDRWAGLSWDPTMSAVSVMLANNPDLPEPHRLPVSWRLPTSAASVVSAAFYPFTLFRAGDRARATPPRIRDPRAPWLARHGTGRGRRNRLGLVRTPRPAHAAHRPRSGSRHHRLGLPSPGTRRNRPLRTGHPRGHHRTHRHRHRPPRPSRCHPIRPARHARRTDHRRHRQPTPRPRVRRDDRPAPPLRPPRRQRLPPRGYRLCVLTSRHRHACIVVGRAGIPELLDAHPSAEPVHLGVPVKFPDGWEANQSVLSHLAEHRISVAPVH